MKSADPSGVVWAEEIESALSRLLVQQRLGDYGLERADLDRLMANVQLSTQPIEGEGADEGALQGRLVVGLIMVFLLYMMILAYGIQSMNAVIEDKNSRVVEVMLSNVTPSTLMAGKILASALVGLTQFTIWGLLAVGLMGRGVAALPAELVSCPASSFLDADVRRRPGFGQKLAGQDTRMMGITRDFRGRRAHGHVQGVLAGTVRLPCRTGGQQHA